MQKNTRCWSAATALLFLLVPKVESEIIIVESGGKIQDALDEVLPGDTIRIESGHYWEDLVTTVDGTENARITIEGAGGTSGRDSVVLRGGGTNSRMFRLMHDYYTLQDFTIDGQVVDDEDDVSDDNFKDAFRDIPLYVTADREPSERSGGYKSALDGLIVRRMTIQNAGGECVRLRDFVTYADIDGNSIMNCGLYDFVYGDEGKSGEGIYIGTSSKQWDDGKNYSDDPDMCLGIVVRNKIATHGNEGVDVKEGCLETVIKDNQISMQLDEDGGEPTQATRKMDYAHAIDSRADGSIIENNYVENTSGAGIRLGGNTVDGRVYGINNKVTGNTLVNCRAYGIKIMVTPQLTMCGNDVALPPGKDADEYEYSGGDFGGDYNSLDACDGEPSPPPSTSPSPDAVYFGCYKDVFGERTMGYEYKDQENLTNEACIARCKEDSDNMFAGTYNGKTCRCSKVNWRVDRHGESTDCTVECPGDSSTICGGDLAVTSWKLG